MARYHATVESAARQPGTFGYLAIFSNAAEQDPGVLAGDGDDEPVVDGDRDADPDTRQLAGEAIPGRGGGHRPLPEAVAFGRR